MRFHGALGFSGRQMASYGETSSVLDFSFIHYARPQDLAQNNPTATLAEHALLSQGFTGV